MEPDPEHLDILHTPPSSRSEYVSEQTLAQKVEKAKEFWPRLEKHYAGRENVIKDIVKEFRAWRDFDIDALTLWVSIYRVLYLTESLCLVDEFKNFLPHTWNFENLASLHKEIERCADDTELWDALYAKISLHHTQLPTKHKKPTWKRMVQRKKSTWKSTLTLNPLASNYPVSDLRHTQQNGIGDDLVDGWTPVNVLKSTEPLPPCTEIEYMSDKKKAELAYLGLLVQEALRARSKQ